MDKLKAIKVKQTSGQYGEAIPIGVDAANVDLINGKDLETSVAFLDEDSQETDVDFTAVELQRGDIVDNLSSTDGTTKALSANQGRILNQNINTKNTTINQRIDNLNAQFQTAISAVTVDSEVQNIRIKADGTTATSAGDAVREQFGELKSDLYEYGNIADINDVSLWEIGAFKPDGTKLDHAQRLRTKDYIPYNIDKVISKADYTFIWLTFDLSGTLINIHSTFEKEFSPQDGYRYKLVLRPPRTNNVDVYEATNICFITNKFNLSVNIFDIVSNIAILSFDTIEGTIKTSGQFYLFDKNVVTNIPAFSISYDTSSKVVRYLAYNKSNKQMELVERSNYNDTIYKCVAIIDANNNITTNSPCIIDGIQRGRIGLGKKKLINFMGDSITLGRISNPDGTSAGVMAHPYPEIVATRLDCRFNNYGIGGSTVTAGTTGSDPMVSRYSSMKDGADIIFVLAGTNDYGDNWKPCPLGNLTDTSTDTFCGALNTMIKGLIKKYPNAKILFATPLQRYGCRTANRYNAKLEDYVNAIKTRCGNYGIPCLDLYNEGMLCPDLRYDYTTKTYDGLHPNEMFHKEFLAVIIANFISKYI